MALSAKKYIYIYNHLHRTKCPLKINNLDDGYNLHWTYLKDQCKCSLYWFQVINEYECEFYCSKLKINSHKLIYANGLEKTSNN